jgi:hypothetical protein
VQVPGLTGVTAVAAGTQHVLALKADGTVWAWGNGPRGELGIGVSDARLTPVQVPGLTNVVAIAAGGHSLVLKGDGTVWAFGPNATGQIGDGSSTNRLSPVQVPGLSNIVAIAAGDQHSVALKSDGTVWAWGYNANGSIGDGTTTFRFSPVMLSTISGVSSIAAAYMHTHAVKSDGSLWSWGVGSAGELGVGGYGSYLVPTSANATAVSRVASSQGMTFAIKNDGSVVSAGANYWFGLGDGSGSSRSTFAATALSDCVFMVSVGGSPTPSVQWQRKPSGSSTFTNLTENATYIGVTTTTLRIRSATNAMDGDQFRCVVSNGYGTVTSSAAALNVGAPTVAIVSGNNQSAVAGTFNAQPLDVAVWNSAGTQPLVGTSVTFAVQSGGGNLATTNVGSPTLLSTVSATTDVDGTAKIFYKQPSTAGITSQITASSSGSQVVFTTQSIAAGNPPTVPPALKVTNSAPTAIGLVWGNSVPTTSGATIAGYNIYRNGTLLNSSPRLSTNYSDTTVVAGTAYTYTIKAVDSNGSLSVAATVAVSAPASSTSGTFDVFTPTP